MPLISPLDMIIGLIKGFLVLWQLWLFLAVMAAIKIIIRVLEKQRLGKSGIFEIDRMDGQKFEKYLEVLFEKLGYHVERTQYTGDYGADLITKKNGVKTVIQAKRYRKKVGIKAIQEVVAAKGKYDCSEAMVVTNSFFTKPAIELAKANQVDLWNRNQLVNALLSIKKNSNNQHQQLEIAVAKEDTHNEGGHNLCDACGKPISEKVKQYCLANRDRFNGKLYCFDCQRKPKI